MLTFDSRNTRVFSTAPAGTVRLALMSCKFPRASRAVQALFLLLGLVSTEGRTALIETRSFDATLERRSTSGRILLLESSGPMPGRGQLVLLRGAGGPLVAIRTRKVYEAGRFAGQIVREYDVSSLEDGSTYRAILKVRDLIVDTEDLPVRPPEDLDIELDRDRFSSRLSADEELELRSLVLEETDDYEEESSMLSYRLSLVRLPGFSEGFIFPAASGVRWSQTILHPLLLNARWQDSLGVDLSVAYTQLSGYTPPGTDRFALMPTSLYGRYTVYPSASLSFHAYVGIQSTIVLGASGDEPELSDAITLLTYSQPAVGAGISIEVGPQWWLVFDGGTDQFGMSVGIKF